MTAQELSYKGYVGSVEVSVEDEMLRGKVKHIDDLVTYRGRTVQELREAFQESVDEYLAWCKEDGKEPCKAYSGTFNIRIGPDRHKRLAVLSSRENKRINAVVCEAIDYFLEVKDQRTRPAVTVWDQVPTPQLQTVRFSDLVTGSFSEADPKSGPTAIVQWEGSDQWHRNSNQASH